MLQNIIINSSLPGKCCSRPHLSPPEQMHYTYSSSSSSPAKVTVESPPKYSLCFLSFVGLVDDKVCVPPVDFFLKIFPKPLFPPWLEDSKYRDNDG